MIDFHFKKYLVVQLNIMINNSALKNSYLQYKIFTTLKQCGYALRGQFVFI